MSSTVPSKATRDSSTVYRLYCEHLICLYFIKGQFDESFLYWLGDCLLFIYLITLISQFSVIEY